MATEVLMPQMGESIAEGTVTKWMVEVGDSVEKDDPIMEISTDKVDAEIPSPASGVLLEKRVNEGDTVPVNQIVAMIGEAGESAGAAAAPVAEVVEVPEAAPSAAPPAAPTPQSLAPEANEVEPGSLEERIRRHSSPLVRSIAAREGVDLQELEGTGIHGRVTKSDIMSYLEKRKASPAPAVTTTAIAAPAPAASMPAPRPAAESGFFVPAFTEGERVEIEPMSKIRQITAAHMVYSRRTSAHVSTVFHFDFTKVAKVRAKAKDGFFKEYGTKLTYMPFIFKAICSALRKFPKLNASIDGTNIVLKKDVNLGMAVALDRGLLVPVIRKADHLSLAGLAKAANDLADRARTKKISPDDLRGGTFTVTNPGVFGSLFGTPIINQPQVAIMGLGTIEKRPVVISDSEGNDWIGIKTMSYISLTYDHRLVDGADAEHFMNHVKDIIEAGDWEELGPFI